MIQKDKARVDIFGERFRTRASQLTPGLRVVASYINEHREGVLEQTAMEIAATLNTSGATVIMAIQALVFALWNSGLVQPLVPAKRCLRR